MSISLQDLLRHRAVDCLALAAVGINTEQYTKFAEALEAEADRLDAAGGA